ncbi:MAG: four helix bundle protein [Nitrosomonadaceae bacterium]|nr:MAG: four helix bundle protein [Nitrosomonadaceae bacterium]
MARFEDLAVWKRSARLSAELYKSLRDLKDFGFRDQITRAGLSIPSNIAEGYERESAKETTNFLNYAKGSAGELRTQLYIGMDIGYIERETGMQWIKEVEEISRMLHGLMQAVRTQKT